MSLIISVAQHPMPSKHQPCCIIGHCTCAQQAGAGLSNNTECRGSEGTFWIKASEGIHRAGVMTVTGNRSNLCEKDLRFGLRYGDYTVLLISECIDYFIIEYVGIAFAWKCVVNDRTYRFSAQQIKYISPFH